MVRLPSRQSPPRADQARLLRERMAPRKFKRRVPPPRTLSEVGPCLCNEECLKMLRLVEPFPF